MKKSSNFIESSGLLIFCENKILLLKPKGLANGHFSIPKGVIEDNESIKDAAIRETQEEIGLLIDKNSLKNQYIVNYFNKGFLTKRVYCYLVNINDKKTKDFKFKIQEDEVDKVAFYSLEEAKKLIFWRFKKLLDQIEI